MFLLFLTTSLNFLFLLTMGRTFRPLCFYVFSALLLSSFSQLTFLQFWSIRVKIWVQGGTFSLFLTTSLNFVFSLTVGRSFRPVMFLCFFYTFVISILILSCQSTVSLLFIIHLEFWAWLFAINTSKELKGRFGLFLHFQLLSQKRPQQRACENHSWAKSFIQKLACARYYWPSIQVDAKSFVQACDKCQWYNNVPRRPLKHLTSMTVSWPFA